MDALNIQSSERARPPYPRTASRSSTSTSNTRITHKSANSSTSQIPNSPSLSSSHGQHRFHHAPCAKPPGSPRASTPRAASRLSREASTESNRQIAISSFLQEKLERERQAESEKAASMTRSHHDMSASLDLGWAKQSSPAKSGESDIGRPKSSGGSESSRKQGLGVKEMEQVMSNLHKQNFDLKLELFHRREKQTALEDRLETLESEMAEMEETNDKLLEELEKRDKAVGEAVAMIVQLEARLEDLEQERSMARQIEAAESYVEPYNDPAYENPVPRIKAPDVKKLENDAKVLNRMPSFLSEHTDNAENLRNVYLGMKGSVLSLPRLEEGSRDMDNSPPTGLASPSLSVLSESSFVSVYGSKRQEPDDSSQVEEPPPLGSLDGAPDKARAIGRPQTALGKTQSASKTARSNSISGTNGHGQYQSLTSIIGQGSPLQQVERAYSLKEDGRLRTRDEDPASPRAIPNSVAKSPARGQIRDEKREALRRVLTDAPGGVRLLDNGLPPTPDTISTSTLRRFQNSDDTLARQQRMVEHRSYDSMSDQTAHDENFGETLSGAKLEAPSPHVKRVAGHARKFNASTYSEGLVLAVQRPRSAGASTISRRRGNDWISDSEDDSDTRSLESSLDIWMRESTKPDRNGGRASPDLFNFPTSKSRGWAMDAMVGTGNSHGEDGGVSTIIDADRMYELFPVQEVLFGNSAPPPPPNRRSSLHAQTGATSTTASIKHAARASLPNSPDRRTRQSRRDSDAVPMNRDVKTPVPQQQQQQQQSPSNEQKRSHYPPISGQHGGARSSLNRLFRRSIGGGGSSSNASEAGSMKKSEDPVQASPRSASAMGFPPWVTRNGALDDDQESATPPPIIRNPRQSRPASVKVDAPMPKTAEAEPHTPTTAAPAGEAVTPSEHTPQTQGSSSPRVPSATGHRRKWLPGFGLASSLRNRNN